MSKLIEDIILGSLWVICLLLFISATLSLISCIIYTILFHFELVGRFHCFQ